MNTDTLATELLHEIKRSAKRWFIAFLVMVGVEICTIAGFLWYINLSAEKTVYEQSVQDVENSGIEQQIGNENYGDSETENNLQEKNNEE